MSIQLIPYQITEASGKLLEYGLLGVIIIFVGYFAYQMYKKINEDQKIWRNEAIASRKDLTGLMIKQNELNGKLISIREKDVDQAKENFHDIRQQLDKLPADIKRELQIELLDAKCEHKNKTSAG